MSDGQPRSCLYRGRVMHHRLRPVGHRFTYRVFSLYLDLDELPELDRRLRLFSAERWNLLGFKNRDHGPRDGSPLKPWVLERLAESGITLARPKIRLLCFPRLLGYVFDPLSIYFCFDGETLAALLYEVKNTFGEQHTYAFAVQTPGPDGRITPHGCAKRFYVSPFVDMDMRYRFHLAAPGERLKVVIRETQGGELLLLASQIGDRLPLTDASLAKVMTRDILMTLKVIIGIHVEALRLWRKGVPLYARPVGVTPQPRSG